MFKKALFVLVAFASGIYVDRKYTATVDKAAECIAAKFQKMTDKMNAADPDPAESPAE